MRRFENMCVCDGEEKMREMTVSGVNYVVWSVCTAVMPPPPHREIVYLCVCAWVYVYKRDAAVHT